MDELWIILLGIAFSIFSTIKESRRKAARKAIAEAEEEIQREIRRSREMTEREAEMRRKGTEPEVVFEPVVIRSEESRKPENQAPAAPRLSEAEEAMWHIANRNVSKKKRKAAEPKDKAADQTKEESIAEDFDLRRAVIYSEILKPKFDDAI